MGLKYILFRAFHEFVRRTGLLKILYPSKFRLKKNISLSQWRKEARPFFFHDRENLRIPTINNERLAHEFRQFQKGFLLFFNSEYMAMGSDNEWMTNPSNGFVYDVAKHWTEIDDFGDDTGDIKYVWEKSRFSFIYSLIRYDYHYGPDCSKLVIGKILSWIQANPPNQGPNYRCSQEISLRVLNWIFALYYYRNAESLTEEQFGLILRSIHIQMEHVRRNIHFSRIAVRNNHALTETLALYIVGLLFPDFPEAEAWRLKGKKWFIEETLFQIMEDGTYLQYSMNYQRVVVQLLGWAIRLSELNSDPFPDAVYDRGRKTVRFLFNHLNVRDGYLPNYGANDGALFFRLSDCPYRDFRPQLTALQAIIDGEKSFIDPMILEELHWFYGMQNLEQRPVAKFQMPVGVFPFGGFYSIRDKRSFTFLRCGNHPYRPSHADNLHLDIWIDGMNIFRDGGSYRYNTKPEWQQYFMGTRSHNTVMLDGQNQMQKGPRFIWYHWTQAISAGITETESHYRFEGSIRAFGHLGKNIIHSRTVIKHKTKRHWEVIDHVQHSTGHPIVQIWNPLPDVLKHIHISAEDELGNPIICQPEKGWYSEVYGSMQPIDIITFSTKTSKIRTMIEA